MKKAMLLITLILFWVAGHAQESKGSDIPDWYLEEMQRLVGTWITSNQDYMDGTTINDAFGIEWKWGVGQKSLVGVLYGLREKQKTKEYWQFFQYWDSGKGKPIFIQVSAKGVQGVGHFERVDSKHFQLVQIFTEPDGSTSKSGHKTQILKGYEISTSFNINEQDEWELNRTYTWYKQK